MDCTAGHTAWEAAKILLVFVVLPGVAYLALLKFVVGPRLDRKWEHDHLGAKTWDEYFELKRRG